MPPGLMDDLTFRLELVKLAVSLLTPLLVALFGFTINRNLQRLTAAQWRNQKAVERRLTFFDQVAPWLNDVYCYVLQVGNWKELSPFEVIGLKRKLDKAFYVNAALFPSPLLRRYITFI